MAEPRTATVIPRLPIVAAVAGLLVAVTLGVALHRSVDTEPLRGPMAVTAAIVVAAVTGLLATSLWRFALTRGRLAAAHAATAELRQEVARHTATLEALEATNAFHAGVFENSPDGLLVVDESGVVLRANARCAEFIGRRRDELIGVCADELVPVRFRAEHAERRASFARSPAPRPMALGREMWILHADGREIPVDINLGPIPTSNGLHVLAAIRDARERKSAERALSESEQRYRRFFADNVVPTFETALDGTLRDCNDAFVRLFELPSREAALGIDTKALYADPDERRQLIADVRRDGAVLSREIAVRSPAGRAFVVVGAVTALRDETGGVHALTGFLRDVSEERRLRDEVEQMRRTEMIGKLAAGIAHDFNNVLAAVLGSVELVLRRGQLSERDRALLMEAVTAANGGAGLTGQLLAFGRKRVSRPKRLEIGETLRVWEPVVKRLLGAAISVHVEVPEHELCVYMDPSQFEQVVLNLAVNARDAMPNGGDVFIGARSVTLEPGDVAGTSAGHFACVRVKDSGCGIDAATRDRLFEPFFTTKSAGTGLGLANVAAVAHDVAGAVVCDSELGRGAEFRVYIPLLAEGALADDAPGDTHARHNGADALAIDEDAGLLDGRETRGQSGNSA